MLMLWLSKCYWSNYVRQPGTFETESESDVKHWKNKQHISCSLNLILFSVKVHGFFLTLGFEQDFFLPSTHGDIFLVEFCEQNFSQKFPISFPPLSFSPNAPSTFYNAELFWALRQTVFALWELRIEEKSCWKSKQWSLQQYIFKHEFVHSFG